MQKTISFHKMYTFGMFSYNNKAGGFFSQKGAVFTNTHKSFMQNKTPINIFSKRLYFSRLNEILGDFNPFGN